MTRPKVALAHRPELDGDALPTLAEMEETNVRLRLDHLGGNMSAAARSLGIDRRTMYRKAHEYGLMEPVERMVRGYRVRPVAIRSKT